VTHNQAHHNRHSTGSPHINLGTALFLDHAQRYHFAVILCEFINIQLPYQKTPTFLLPEPVPWLPPPRNSIFRSVSLIPYIRRLFCSGNNTDTILREFFGSCWYSGIGTLQERQNYLCAAKSAPWDKRKLAYDIGSQKTAPHLVPLRDATVKEIMDAERYWTEWMGMQDWMLGPRRPTSLDSGGIEEHICADGPIVNVSMKDERAT
jgi:hypothetical protein